jgi:hypothetical protein
MGNFVGAFVFVGDLVGANVGGLIVLIFLIFPVLRLDLVDFVFLDAATSGVVMIISQRTANGDTHVKSRVTTFIVEYE